MDCWKVIKVGHGIKLKRIGGQETEVASEKREARVVIRHKVRLKGPRYLRRLLRLWQ